MLVNISVFILFSVIYFFIISSETRALFWKSHLFKIAFICYFGGMWLGFNFFMSRGTNPYLMIAIGFVYTGGYLLFKKVIVKRLEK